MLDNVVQRALAEMQENIAKQLAQFRDEVVTPLSTRFNDLEARGDALLAAVPAAAPADSWKEAIPAPEANARQAFFEATVARFETIVSDIGADLREHKRHVMARLAALSYTVAAGVESFSQRMQDHLEILESTPSGLGRSRRRIRSRSSRE